MFTCCQSSFTSFSQLSRFNTCTAACVSVYLLCPRERWRSIVISTSVCVCVCVSVCLSVCLSVRDDISGITRAIFTNFLSVHVAYGRGSVLRRQGDEIPRGRGSFGVVFFHIDTALYSIVFGTHTKTAQPIEMQFGLRTRVGPVNHVLAGGPHPHGKGQF